MSRPEGQRCRSVISEKCDVVLFCTSEDEVVRPSSPKLLKRLGADLGDPPLDRVARIDRPTTSFGKDAIFTNDDPNVLSVSDDDGCVCVWRADHRDLLQSANRILSRGFTEEEHKRYTEPLTE